MFKKEYKILNLIDRMNEYKVNNQYVFILFILKYKIIREYIEYFIKCDKPNETELDVARDIIVHAKNLYEMEEYSEPFDDKLYDMLLSKYNEYRDEPYSDNVSNGLIETPYKYDKLAGTLDKVHFVYNNERDKYETRESLEDYLRNLPTTKDGELKVLVNQKKDGTSVTIDYKLIENGDEPYYITNLATTRGNRSSDLGADVTRVFEYLKCFAVELNGEKLILDAFGYYPKYIGVQYEFIITNANKKKFEKYIGKTFANNRSAASGLLRRMIFASNKELKILREFISLVPVGYDILDEYNEWKDDKYSEYMQKFYAVFYTFYHGVISMGSYYIHGNVDEILESFKDKASKEYNKRNMLDHAIDGLVLTILNEDLIKKLGRKNSKNKYQIAYKFKEEEYKTKVRDLIVTVGNFGYIGLLLKVDPVKLNGTIQEKAQIHSLDKFNNMDIRIGDEIILKLSGDVIPFGYKTDDCIKGDGDRIELPEYCECGSKLIEENNMLRCINPKCKYRIVGYLNTFLIEMGAKGIGDKLCEKIYEKFGIDNPLDLLTLKYEDFLQLDGFKHKSALKCEEILSKIVSEPKKPEVILSSLCIDSFRKSTAKKLLDVISIEELVDIVMNDNITKLVNILKSADGIDMNAMKIAQGLIENKNILKKLVSLIPIKIKNIYNNIDKILVISGFRDDDEFIELANIAGYDVKNSSKKMDLLVIANDSFMDKSKAKFALANNIPIMTKSQFIEKYK